MIGNQATLTKNNPFVRLTFLGNQGLRTLAEAEIASALHDLLRRADLLYSFRVALEFSRSGSYSAGLNMKEAFREGVECTWCKDDTGNSPSVQVLVYLPLGYQASIHKAKPAQDLFTRMLAAQKIASITVEDQSISQVVETKPKIEHILEELKRLNKIGPHGGMERDDLLLVLNLKFELEIPDARDLLDGFVKSGHLYKESHQGYVLDMRFIKYFGPVPTLKTSKLERVQTAKIAGPKKNDDNTLGARLKRFREANGISEERMANAAGVGVLALRSAENDLRINFKTKRLLLKGLEDWIL